MTIIGVSHALSMSASEVNIQTFEDNLNLLSNGDVNIHSVNAIKLNTNDNKHIQIGGE